MSRFRFRRAARALLCIMQTGGFRRLAATVLALALVVCPLLAVAQAVVAPVVAAAPSSIVDLSGFASLVSTTVFTVLAALLTWVAHKLVSVAVDRLHISIGDAQRALVDTAIMNGLAWAQHSLEGKLEGKTSLDVRNAMVAEIVNYATPKIPAALAYFGITPEGLAQRAAAAVTKALGTDPLAKPITAAAA